jgi:hypothetical protein
MTVGDRKTRDEQRAAQVKELAAKELQEHRPLAEAPFPPAVPPPAGS